ncbi:putative leucine-rich repeat receptor-like serine/threonine-protein kinase [Hibiscus syriacus]|uniref:RING-type E3 ubiquitin transferase n=1 Tax=Hibiscus syriacus TaxID=106335 RepID=A0A6A2Y8I0_HIBSY|nr:putative leucine-rich repeat receptor-like serine/threonine-protein kinase [Hibiscus syriacus]
MRKYKGIARTRVRAKYNSYPSIALSRAALYPYVAYSADQRRAIPTCKPCHRITRLHISEHEEDGSLYQTQNSIHALWDKFAGVNSDKQSDAPASSSQASAPPNFNAASDDIQSGNIVTLAPSVLYFKEDTDKDHRRIKTRENDSNGDKSSGLRRKGRSTAESRSKFWNEKPEAEVACAYGSSEDEDVCPTCLDEYERENPRIVLQCSHSYHLGSIYEWMERSENRPICGKLFIECRESNAKPELLALHII